jgi:bifunctional DNA-binding transcriptional regulator/antitoxin component of YhaV-PrlF toxin-antitoxin module
MTVAVKNKAPVVVPPAVLRRAGFKRGQELEVKASGGVITILPKFPSAEDEYTPEQRRIIDAGLARADRDIKAGRMSKPYSDAAEFIADLHKAAARLSRKTKKTKRLAK